MRLFLASYRFGDFADDLVALAGGPGGRVAVISNALDFIPLEARAAYARTGYDQMQALRELGFEPFDLDLRGFFATPEHLAGALRDVALIWATGGNSFLLRRAMRLSRFDELIVRLLAEDRLVYGGYSAGAVVAGPHLHGVELMDPPGLEVDAYPTQPTIWEGLGLIDRPLVPHFRSDHPDSADADRVATALNERGELFETLADGDVLLRRGAVQRILRGHGRAATA